jgi:hypothetical protein
MSSSDAGRAATQSRASRSYLVHVICSTQQPAAVIFLNLKYLPSRCTCAASHLESLEASGSGPTPGGLNAISKDKGFIRGPAPPNFVIGWGLLLVGLACAPLSRAERHTLRELLGGAAVTAGNLTISDWHLDQTPRPKTGSTPQDINAITVDVTTTPGVSTVVLRFDTADRLKVRERKKLTSCFVTP